jgi:hypothetical protein
MESQKLCVFNLVNKRSGVNEMMFRHAMSHLAARVGAQKGPVHVMKNMKLPHADQTSTTTKSYSRSSKSDGVCLWQLTNTVLLQWKLHEVGTWTK